MAHLNSESISAVKDQAAHLFQSIVEQATSKAMDEAKASRSRASRFARTARGKTSPSAREIALNAASGAIELWQAARDRASGTVETVQSTVTDSAAGIKHGAQELTQDAVDRAKSVGSAVGEIPHRAADSGKSAVAGTAKAGRNTLGFAFWTAAAGAIVYYAFMDEQRRNQAREIVMRAISEGRALLSDLQGQDGQFAG
jgi:hypothetical protein